MEHADVVPIILVGFEDLPVAQRLEARLREAGYPMLAPRDLRRIPALLAGLRDAAIVVFDSGAFRAAKQALGLVCEFRTRPAVVAVVQNADFGQYYALMNQGAIGHFKAREPLSLIFAGVTLAPRQAQAA